MKRQKAATTSMRPFYIALGIIALGGIGALAWLSSRPKAEVKTAATVTAAQATGHLYGNANAPVQILEFADFECPACEHYTTLTEPDVRKRIIDAGLASFRFFDYPLSIHKNTWHASDAAACAEEQGKFWEMHDEIFRRQPDWNGEATSNPKKVLKEIAGTVGVDVGKWEECYDGQRHRGAIQANQAEGERRGVSQTPTFVIGRRTIPGALGFDQFKAYVDSAMADAKAAGAAGPAAPAADSGAAKGKAAAPAATKAP